MDSGRFGDRDYLPHNARTNYQGKTNATNFNEETNFNEKKTPRKSHNGWAQNSCYHLKEEEASGGYFKAPSTAKRNARERRRVEAVNEAFCKLSRLVPLIRSKDRSKRVSKLKTLASVMEYIAILTDLLSSEQNEWRFDCHQEDIVSYRITYKCDANFMQG